MLPILSAILTLALALPAMPQDPPRPTGTGVIVGRVVDGTNDQRIAGALVLLTGGNLPGGEKTFADSDGWFTFDRLPTGEFMINVKRGGYNDGGYGQRRPGGPGRALILAPGERRDGLTIRLFPSSAILGTVTDEVGEPVVKNKVIAYRRLTSNTGSTLIQVGESMTDDRGVYRIDRLNPGNYVIAVPMAGATPLMSGATSLGMVRDGGGSTAHLPPLNGKVQKFPTTYYPAGATAREAATIALGVGEVHRNVDVQLRPQRVVNINGKIVADAGSAKGIQMTLTAAGDIEAGGRATATAITGDSGSFSFASIPPGVYVLSALARNAVGADPRPAQWAEQLLPVDDRDLNDVTLYLRNGVRVNGAIAVDGVPPPTGPEVSLRPLPHDPVIPNPTFVADPSGRSFGFRDVIPGQYIVDIRAPAGYAVKSITLQGRDVSRSAFSVTGTDVGGLVITLSDHPSVVTGHVGDIADASGTMVLAFADDRQPVDPSASREILQAATVTSSGGFEIRGLPAGDYLLVALPKGMSADWLDPDFVQELSQKGRRLHLSDGEQQVVDLRVVILR